MKYLNQLSLKGGLKQSEDSDFNRSEAEIHPGLLFWTEKKVGEDQVYLEKMKILAMLHQGRSSVLT